MIKIIVILLIWSTAIVRFAISEIPLSIHPSNPSSYPSYSIYVDPISGLDSNSGTTSTSPVRTISKAQSLARSDGKGTTIFLADGVYRETILPPSPSVMSLTGQLVYRSTNGNYKKVSIRCSNEIRNSAIAPLSGYPSWISKFPAISQSKIYVANLTSLGWNSANYLRFRDDSSWEQRAAGLLFLIQSSTGSLDPTLRYMTARAPNFKNVTNWKRAEYWWRADGPSTGSTTTLVDATDDQVPSDIQPGNLKSIGQDLSGAYVRALDGLNSHWLWYRRIISHNISSGTITIDTDTSGSCSSSTGKCSGCQPKSACGTANADTGGYGFSSVTKYYIDNHPYLLDTAGEYYIDKTSGLLFFIPMDGYTIDSTFSFELSKRRIAVDLSNTVNITFDSLTFEMCDDSALYANDWSQINTRYITMRNIQVQLSGRGISIIKSVVQDGTTGSTDYTEQISLIQSSIHHIEDQYLYLNQGWWGCSISSLGSSCEHNQYKDFYFGNNAFYEIGFQPFSDSGDGAGILGNRLTFELNVVRNVAHNGLQFGSGPAISTAVYPYSASDLISSTVLISNNIFEWTCLLESDCGGLKHYSGDSGFRDHLITGNVFRYIIGWSVAWEESNKIPTDWAYYNPITRAYWSTMLGFAFGSYMDYAPGSYHFRNIAYNIGMNCYQFTARSAEMRLYFHNNLAVNCYRGFASSWAIGNGHKGTSIQGNIFAALRLGGLQMSRTGQTNGIPRSFQADPTNGLFIMNYNIWNRVGHDNRTDSVYRRGLVDVGYVDSSANGGNPTASLMGLRNYEPTVGTNDSEADAMFSGFNTNTYSNSILSRSQADTLYSYVTDNNVDWTAFSLSQGSSAIDYLPALPAELMRVFRIWNILPVRLGKRLDAGPLESGVTWNTAMKGPTFPTVTSAPTSSPSKSPSVSPSLPLTSVPSQLPTSTPTLFPSSTPSILPTSSPSKLPTSTPSKLPTSTPSKLPTSTPSKLPTSTPTKLPTSTLSKLPTSTPSKLPTSTPSKLPTSTPTKLSTSTPTKLPTSTPTKRPSSFPSKLPTLTPTKRPTSTPSKLPTSTPTKQSTSTPTKLSTSNPSKSPTSVPSILTKIPTRSPSKKPVALPTYTPTSFPSRFPSTRTNSPTASPSKVPTSRPTVTPSSTNKPSSRPTTSNTFTPTVKPTVKPTATPSFRPSAKPTTSPSRTPTSSPSTVRPTIQSSRSPTFRPTGRPTLVPTGVSATLKPTSRPTGKPTTRPSGRPTVNPTMIPTKRPL